MERSNRSPMEIEEQVDGDLGSKRMVVNFGPQHPATHGTLRSIIEIEGETVTSMDLEIGYLHTGFEKLGENRTYNQTMTLSDRLNYLSPLCNNVGLAVACERLLGIQTTPRCDAIRVIMYELARIADHIVCVGLQAMDLGAFSVMLWAFIEREKMYDIFEAVTGARLTTSYTRVGGLMRDVPHDFEAMVRKVMTEAHKAIVEMEGMLNENRIFRDRCIGVGILSRDDSISYGLTGPLLRATGVAYDIRKANPYCGYEKYDFDIATETGCDVFSRYRVRVKEMYESLKIIDQALTNLPDGPVNVADPEVIIPSKDQHNHPTGGMEGLIYHFKNYMYGHGIQPPVGEFYTGTEAPNGELGYYLVSDGTQKPWRWRVRGPSFYNYQCFPHMCRGGSISDVVSCLSSLNVIAGELDR